MGKKRNQFWENNHCYANTAINPITNLERCPSWRRVGGFLRTARPASPSWSPSSSGSSSTRSPQRVLIISHPCPSPQLLIQDTMVPHSCNSHKGKSQQASPDVLVIYFLSTKRKTAMGIHLCTESTQSGRKVNTKIVAAYWQISYRVIFLTAPPP